MISPVTGFPLEGVPPVERDQALHRARVLLDERVVRAQPRVECVDAFLRREGAEDRASDVVRKDVRDDEHERGEQPQRDEREHQPAQQPASHRLTLSLVIFDSRGSGGASEARSPCMDGR